LKIFFINRLLNSLCQIKSLFWQLLGYSLVFQKGLSFEHVTKRGQKTLVFQIKDNFLNIYWIKPKKGLNFSLIFPTFLLGVLLVVSVTNPTASTVFAIKGGIPNGGNSANAPSPNDQALANACANTAGKPNQPPFCVSVPPPLDSDGDGIPDAIDPCPADPTNTCPKDSDNDGIPDSLDPCPADPTNTCPTTDSDNDGIRDSADECPFDPSNTCDTRDVDSDMDGTSDSLDPCPFDPTDNCSRDFDNDGIPDIRDPCPTDPTNTCPMDSDNDGIPDESDPCPFDPTNACIQ
jgi:hypothetical protein